MLLGYCSHYTHTPPRLGFPHPPPPATSGIKLIAVPETPPPLGPSMPDSSSQSVPYQPALIPTPFAPPSADLNVLCVSELPADSHQHLFNNRTESLQYFLPSYPFRRCHCCLKYLKRLRAVWGGPPGTVEWTVWPCAPSSLAFRHPEASPPLFSIAITRLCAPFGILFESRPTWCRPDGLRLSRTPTSTGTLSREPSATHHLLPQAAPPKSSQTRAEHERSAREKVLILMNWPVPSLTPTQLYTHGESPPRSRARIARNPLPAAARRRSWRPLHGRRLSILRQRRRRACHAGTRQCSTASLTPTILFQCGRDPRAGRRAFILPQECQGCL